MNEIKTILDEKQQVINTVCNLCKKFKRQGYHCSESVIRAASQGLDLKMPEEVFRCASGFRGGGGGYRDRCGVIEAGCMIISYLYGRLSYTQEVWRYSYLIREFHQRFQQRFGSIYCRDILEKEKALDKQDLCLDTYCEGATPLIDLIFEASDLLKNIPEDEKMK